VADDLDELHARVALDLLAADPGLGPDRVYDGKVPDGSEPPYVLVYTTVSRPAGGAGAANALDGRDVTIITDWYCHCVGGTAAAARAVSMRVNRALHNVRPTITGRSCSMVRQGETTPPNRDETTGVMVMDLVVTYQLITTP